MPETPTIEPKITPAAKSAARPADPKPLPPYNVVLIDDDDHSYGYVIEMLGKLFGHSTETAYQMACKVDAEGRVIVYTTHKEKAELKRELIHGFGADITMARSNGPMAAVIEPAG